MEENKKLEDEDLEQVNGGQARKAVKPSIELVTDEKEETKSTDCYPFIHCSPIKS